jgi:hypothetical protein
LVANGILFSTYDLQEKRIQGIPQVAASWCPTLHTLRGERT